MNMRASGLLGNMRKALRHAEASSGGRARRAILSAAAREAGGAQAEAGDRSAREPLRGSTLAAEAVGPPWSPLDAGPWRRRLDGVRPWWRRKVFANCAAWR